MSEGDASLSDRERVKQKLVSQIHLLYGDLLTRWEKALRDKREEMWTHQAAYAFAAESQEDFKKRLDAEVAAEKMGYQERRDKIIRTIQESL